MISYSGGRRKNGDVEMADDAYESAEREKNQNRQLFAAAVAEFASILQTAGFPKEVKTLQGGKDRIGVAMPRFSWSMFYGDRQQALHHIQTVGLLRDENPNGGDNDFSTEPTSKSKLNS